MSLKYILVFFISFTLFSKAYADSDGEDYNLISVSGKAEVQVVPDEIHVSFTIKKNDKSLKEAQKQNDDVADKLLRAMKNKLQIEEKNIQTNFINVNPVYTYVRCNNNDRFVPSDNQNCNTQVFSHFETQKGIAVKLKETDKLEKLLEEAIDAGVTNINSVNFASSKFDELQKKAQLMAAKDAKKNAEDIAESLGVSIDKPYRINASSYNAPVPPQPNMRMMAMAMESADASASTIALGELTITANVNAQFIID
ncbi:MAG: hypothetical protein COV35_04910 [Alphaproteobacteria bacterium CG11_big_fil_rev_8_21_14_0_20_39_49]|nr:MAG: hypothetical protein COV35_04910 [Alphaproteobacteria bacterium CG11_big_fil_rev_8_21_14_0_20_39_49]